MKKVFALIEKESAKFAQLPFFELIVNKSNAFIQRLSFGFWFALFVMGSGDFNKFLWLKEATVNPIQYIVNKQIREEENHWIWFLKDLEFFAFNLFLDFTYSLKFISRQIIYELYRRSFQVNPLYRGKQEESCPLSPAFVDKIFGVAELKYKSGCRDVVFIRLYKDFGIMQNHFHTWNQQRQIFELFTALMVVNFAEQYNIKKLLTRSFDGSDFAQLLCKKKVTVGV
ncbi:hypothetical protein [Nostoc sphaeroides]|uniref:Uncharacterized protein n=1 Tax=Nostoc sphaeroides CCNUC1 TaxID=2653204 RepID=A0A5P8VSQ1_9NOSO|nr:hypothetical protein [Nostoc sphaeroides]QFS42939.1 hypothetical protein GXM_00412 [Nostoc sphaeroides CCNUC1]